MGYKQFHASMNDDLLESIGKAVITKRDEDARAYWVSLYEEKGECITGHPYWDEDTGCSCQVREHKWILQDHFDKLGFDMDAMDKGAKWILP